LHVLQEPPKDKEKEKEKGDDPEKGQAKPATPTPPAVWTQAESLFVFGTGVEVVKDLTTHRQGRDRSLAGNDSFAKTQAKTDSSRSQILWFLDLSRLVKLLLQVGARGNDGQAQQNEVLVQELGVNGLKAVGGPRHRRLLPDLELGPRSRL
jgi:hypothetical protein